MSLLDGAAMAAYFAFVLSVGFAQARRAKPTPESFYLGSRRIPWPLLALSGAISNFDLTGTMWMVSVLVSFGMQSWWRQWMWGVALPAFGMAYMARWVRSSHALTGADWMLTRFGDDAGARMARRSYALAAVLFTAGSVAYALQGLIKFVDFYLRDALSAEQWISAERALGASPALLAALAILALTTAYVLVGGLFSVVATDAVQALVLTLASFVIAGIAFARATPEAIAAHLPTDFASLTPQWRLTGWRLAERPEYAAFGWFVIAWVGKGVLMNAGGPAQMYDFQRYLATRTPRDACKLAAAWPLFLAPRWALVMGIALLAKTGGAATGDAEQFLPAILRDNLPAGVHGVVVAGFVAAFMTTLSATINSGAAYFVHDLLPTTRSSERDARRLACINVAATLTIVVVGAAAGTISRSIDAVWNWLQMSFISGLVVPNCLRWYWWRLNGWGYAAGVAAGSACSLGLLVLGDVPDYAALAALCGATTLICVATSLLTRPTAAAVLLEFFRTVRPFGAWKPVAAAAAALPPLPSAAHSPATPRILFNLAVAVVGLTALYLGPMYIVGHWYFETFVCVALVLLAAAVLRFSWYPSLPPE